MKVVLPRIGALVIVVVLGWIAIAQAQRNSAKSTADEIDTANPIRSEDDSADNTANPLRDSGTTQVSTPPVNRNRTQNATTGETRSRRAVADPFAAQSRGTGSQPSRLASNDDTTIPDASPLSIAAPQEPNRLRSQPDAQRLREEQPRYSPGMAQAASEPMQNEPPKQSRRSQEISQVAGESAVDDGPSLLAAQATRLAGDDRRVPSSSQRPAPLVGNSRPAAAQPSETEQEPAPFKIDPFAQPASRLPAIPEDTERTSTSLAVAEKSSVRTAPITIETGPVMEPAAGADGTGVPGGKQLEGAQSPQLTIQKLAPKEIQVGKPAVFRVTVRNVGQVAASEVEVRDQVPKGTQLMSTTPRAAKNQRGELVWTVGALRPNQECVVEMQLMPVAEGEVGSVATVHFGADASARCVATRPKLVVETSAPKQVMIGDKLALSIVISNPGTGVATGVVIEERIPAGLQHPAGAELEYEVGDLKPGESRKIDLPLTAGRPGAVTNVLAVRGDGNLRAEHKCNFEVVAPQLDVVLEGPKRRYLEREATYQLSVVNPGTAPAQQVELVAYLPSGLKFVNANNAGYYDEASRTVHWRLEELPANESGSVELVTMPIEPGEQAIKLRGTAQKGLTVEKDQPVLIEGIAALHFQVASSTNPVQINGTTTYEIKVANQGSKASNNIRLTVEVPHQLETVGADGPTQAKRTDSGHVAFDTLARLAPKADATYRVRVKGIKPGDLRVRFQVQSDEMQSPVTKEECTQVFGDE